MAVKKIAVVDDDRDHQMTLGRLLAAQGYEVVSATDAMQAVLVVRREKPDLMLLDIGLPAGDGYVVLQRLRSLGHMAKIPIIVLSAADRAAHAEKASAAGAFEYFQKPVEFAELLAAIRRALGEGAAASTKEPGTT